MNCNTYNITYRSSLISVSAKIWFFLYISNTYQGYCAIQWKQSSSTTPDPYQVGYKATSTIDNTDCGPTSEYGAFTSIPGLIVMIKV